MISDGDSNCLVELQIEQESPSEAIEVDWGNFLDKYPKWIRIPLKRVLFSAFYFLLGMGEDC